MNPILGISITENRYYVTFMLSEPEVAIGKFSYIPFSLSILNLN